MLGQIRRSDTLFEKMIEHAVGRQAAHDDRPFERVARSIDAI